MGAVARSIKARQAEATIINPRPSFSQQLYQQFGSPLTPAAMLNFSRLAAFSLLAAVGVLAETHTVTFENKSVYSFHVTALRFKLKHIPL